VKEFCRLPYSPLSETLAQGQAPPPYGKDRYPATVREPIAHGDV
jgi:hypothetical protein